MCARFKFFKNYTLRLKIEINFWNNIFLQSFIPVNENNKIHKHHLNLTDNHRTESSKTPQRHVCMTQT